MMKQKRTLLILTVVLVAVIAGAAVLYGKFADDFAVDQLGVLGGTSAESEEPADTSSADTSAADTSAADTSAEETVPADTDAPAANPAMDFTVYDIEGNPVRLSDHFGTPIVLNFWASWCGPCKSEMPEFDAKAAELAGQVTFLMVNMTDGDRETVEVASGYVAEHGFTFPVFYDTDSDAAVTYQVYSLPTTYFIDAEGNLIAYASGAIDGETLQRGIDMILE